MERKFFIPEVIQTSAMDCGPAALKAMLEGFGISASYGRLREACQTSVDGTNIDTIEDVMIQLGLDAEQVMLPPDHLLIEEAQALPALVVVRLANGLTHFIIIWNVFGSWVQIMDPGVGRRWVTRQQLLDQLFIHQFSVPATAWRNWAASSQLIDPLRVRMEALQIPKTTIQALIQTASDDPTWRSLAALDASTRMVTMLVKAGGLEAGQEALSMLQQLFAGNRLAQPTPQTIPIPPPLWLANAPAAPNLTGQIILQGAVLIRVKGVREPRLSADEDAHIPEPLPPELRAALDEAPINPEREIWERVREDGLYPLMLIGIGMAIATVGVLIQTLILQGILQVGQILPLLGEPVVVGVGIVVFFAMLFTLNLTVNALTQRMGRRLETRLRIAFLEKLPRLNDRYFHSRLVSDMAQRAHDLRSLRTFPSEVIELVRMGFELILITIGITLLKPDIGFFSLVATGLFVGITLATRPFLQERGMRLRVHSGALSRFFLDAMQGLIPLKTHSAERAFRREYDGQMIEWGRANLEYGRMIALLQAVGALVYSACSIWIVISFVTQTGSLNNIFLLLYWTLRLPTLSNEFISRLQNYPMLRNGILRLLEPLTTPEAFEEQAPTTAPTTDAPLREAGVAIRMEDVAVVAGGQTLLSGLNFEVRPGEHIAVVGPSGAGKSTLVGLLLGWHTPAHGLCLIDDERLDVQRVKALRQETAWVDPAVQLWNRPLSENLMYGRENTSLAGELYIEQADLMDMIERLPQGMQTSLGESGGLVSGGEGQRVRLGRAMNRQNVRLVILDEPFRGLDREKRRVLLQRARAHWHHATLICITHDVGETVAFDRVMVVENGRVIEDDSPQALAARRSRYLDLLEAETVVREKLWQSAAWRRLKVVNGTVDEL